MIRVRAWNGLLPLSIGSIILKKKKPSNHRCYVNSFFSCAVPARTADHGTFRYAFFYRLTSPSPVCHHRQPAATTTANAATNENSRLRSSQLMEQQQQQQQQMVVDLSCQKDDGDSPTRRIVDVYVGHAESGAAAAVSLLPPSLEYASCCCGAPAMVATPCGRWEAASSSCGTAGANEVLAQRFGAAADKGGNVATNTGTAAIKDKTSGTGKGFHGGGYCGGGMFSAQPLLPGAQGVVRRAHERKVISAGGDAVKGGAVEGYGGGTVGGGDRGIGSIQL